MSDGPETLSHYGVKGMRWGVRNQKPPTKNELSNLGETPIVRKTSTGETFSLSKSDNALAKLGRFINKNSVFLDVHGHDGSKIGVASFTSKKDDIYLSWITIDKSQRGRGYATEILKASTEFGKAHGKKRLILEVPPTSVDAHHIYSKLGFKEISHPDRSEDDFIEMEYRFDK